MVSALPLEPVKHSRINVAVGWRASYAAGGGGGGFGGLGGGGLVARRRHGHRRAWRLRRCLYYSGLDKVITSLLVVLVEWRWRAGWYPPGKTDTVGARKAKVLHQINQVVAQSKVRRHRINSFCARHFDLRQDRCRSFGRPHRRRLLRLCCKRPCQPRLRTG